ncbi:MAG: hypothetical protein K6E16_09245 [Lachnospiraceae bacterium]|nr:hypothetical protein [Lachnospiraceae bacterium]
MRYVCLHQLQMHYVSHSEHTYTDVHGAPGRELLITYESTDAAPSRIILFRDPFCMFYEGRTVKIRLPILETELKRFFENYRDYYYLPREDMCILKSAAHGVDPAYRENAKKETCYIRYRGFFIPRLSINSECFRKDYKSKLCYQVYSPDQFTPDVCDELGASVVSYLNN